jgi:catechol 2,3-dioxygenase-like lactoylglutathione lyase family enzyme
MAGARDSVPLMRRQIVLTLALTGLFAQIPAFAQLSAPNDGGIAIGHVHLMSKDPDAMKRIFVEAFGAQPTKAGTLEMLRLPGVFVIINKAEPSGGSGGSVADHVAFSVRDLNVIRTKLAGLNVEMQGPFVQMPDGVRLELIEEQAQTSPVVMHHIHLTAHNVEILRQWYVKTFGARVGSRRDLPTALFNGNQIDFLPAAAATTPAPTRGRALDHIGFEVQNLEVFVKKLAAQGVKMENPFRDLPNLGLKVAFIVDPVGTRIELTEGLRGK